MKKKKSYSIIYYFGGIGILILAWYIGSEVRPDKFPSIIKVLEAIFSEDNINTHLNNVITTFFNSFKGLLISTIISVVLVISVALVSNLEYIINPISVFIKATPVVALVPLFMIIMTSEESYVASSVAISFFPIYIAGIDGLKRVPNKVLNLASVYNTNKWNQLKHFKIGYVLESITSSFQVAGPLSVVGAIVGEYIVGGKMSLGVFIASNTSSLLIVPRFASTILAFLLGFSFYLMGYFLHKWYEKNIRVHK